ncbi:MAG: SDR family oxidoreductase [Bdellovibrionota bacterium]
MQIDLKGKKVLVTAATYGLGLACAEAFAMEGADLFVCSRDEARVDSTIASLSKNGASSVSGTRADLTSGTDLDTLIRVANERLGYVDVLVLNTGHPPTRPLLSATDEEWQHGIDLILKPAIKLTKALLPAMRQRGFGRLIYMGSVFGLQPEPSSIIQSTLRTGLNAFAKCVAAEGAADGVTANVICPGYFLTPLTDSLAGQYAEEAGVSRAQILEQWRDIAPAKRFGEVGDLAALVTFLASSRGAFINGTALTIDGGFLRQY